MPDFSIDKTIIGRISNKKEWESVDILYSPLESLKILEFLRQQYIMTFNFSNKMDKTIIGVRKPKKKRKKYVKS